MEGIFYGWTGKDGAFGFVYPDGSTDRVLVHKRDVAGLEGVGKGARLAFETVSGAKGLRAINISVLLPVTVIEPAKTAVQGRGRVDVWKHDRGFGFITPEGGGGSVRVQASILPPTENGYLCEGHIVEYRGTFTEGERPRAQVVRVVGWDPPDDALFADVDMGPPNWPDDLVDKTEDEPWDYKNTKSRETVPILRSYIRYTYRRVKETNAIRIASSGRRAAFNTGLVSENQEEIFAVMAKHPLPNRQPWRLAGFKKLSDRDIHENFAGNLPPLADYFTDPSVLLYDRRCQLIINVDHILVENLSRFPSKFQEDKHLLRQVLSGAQAEVEKRVYRNYKTAIPQYYRDKGGEGTVQLLLPICLSKASQADVALTVAKNRDGTSYLGSTVLSLDMAYNNARLLSRPDSAWLVP